MNPYIFGINIIWGIFKIRVYDYTHFLSSYQAQKNGHNGTLVRQTFGATTLNHCMHTQLDFESNMGGIPPDDISSHWCAKPKSAKKNEVLNNVKELDPRTLFNKKFFWLRSMYACLYVCVPWHHSQTLGQ